MNKIVTVGLLLFCLGCLMIAGCASAPVAPDDSQSVSIAATFKQLGIGSSISRVLLEIRGNDFETIAQELEISNGVVRAEVEVPLGENRVFGLTAYAGVTALYYGADTADVSSGAVTEVSIYMRPQVPMIKVTPLYRSIDGIGQEGTLSIEVYNIDSLFGISLRLEADSSVIEFLSANKGDFLVPDDSTLFNAWVFPHYVGLGYTLEGNRQPKGVSGSGLITTVDFVTKNLGSTAVTINPNYLKLIDWQGEELPRQGQLYIENGEVDVIGT